MHNVFHTKDIKLASCLIALGIPYRNNCPVTREIQERNGKPFEQFTFWFDISIDENKLKCGQVFEAYEKGKDWKEYILGVEHPLYYMMGALWNRETLLHWMRTDAEPMKLIFDGARTIAISARASQETKDKLKMHL